MKTAWTKNRNADSVRSFAYRKGKFMKSKVEFYKAFFEELEKKGFGVAQPSSPDYVVDIQFKGKTIAFYTKADMIEKNPFVEVPEKQMERLWSMARATASLCGICSDQPYEEEKAEKLKNGVMKLNEHNGVILACKKHGKTARSPRLRRQSSAWWWIMPSVRNTRTLPMCTGSWRKCARRWATRHLCKSM